MSQHFVTINVYSIKHTIMSIHILALLILVIVGGAYVYSLFFPKHHDPVRIGKILVPICVALLVGYIAGVRSLRDQVAYREIEKVEVFKNQADQEYYFKHNGSVISMLEACENQYPDKIPPHRISSIPNVTVYEKTYISKLGITYGGSGKTFVYVHGYDARIDQNIELK